MKANLRSGIVLAAVAGCACSVAMAQHQSRPPVHKVKQFQRITQSAQAPEPTSLTYNGVTYPYHEGGGSDDNFNIYQNGVGTTSHQAWFTAAYNQGQPVGDRTLDDISFVGSYGAGSGRLLNRITLNLTVANPAPAAPTDGCQVQIVLWNNLNTAGTPTVNTGPNANTPLPNGLAVTFPAPTGGWAINTIYFRDVDLSTLPGGGIQTTSDTFAIELRYYSVTNPGFYHNDLAVGCEGSGVENGTSADVAWDNNASPTPDTNFFDTSDAFNFGGTAGNLTNFAIALRANVTLPTGSCCKVDGTCDATHNVLTCASIGGVYNGDGTTCATANCPPAAACCVSGSCATITSVACAAAGGVYRGDGTCCGTANCPAGFDTGRFTQLNNAGTNIYTGFSSGAIAGAPQRWSAQPFHMGRSATITQINTDGFPATLYAGQTTSAAFTTLRYAIYNRVPNPPSLPVGPAPTTADLVVSGSVPFDRALLVQDTRAPVTFVTPDLFPMTGLNIPLAAGDYWLTVYADGIDTTGASNGGEVNNTGFVNWAWFGNCQLDPSQGNGPIYNYSSAIPAGYMWRSVTFPTPGFAVYNPAAIGVSTAPPYGPNPQDPHYLWNTCFTIICAPPQPQCYANCDSSTTLPCLNVLDFGCFLNKFAAGDCYANCDNSTTPPTLNVLDFGCFLNKFAAGCSNC